MPKNRALEKKAIPDKHKASLQAYECPSYAGETVARSQMPTHRSCTWLEEETQSRHVPGCKTTALRPPASSHSQSPTHGQAVLLTSVLPTENSCL